jgi:N-acetylglutamate synthase-like GNAT family acetyltransferase
VSRDLVARPYGRADLATCLALFDSKVPDFFDPAERAEFEAFLDDLPGPYFLLERSGAAVACGGYAVGEESLAALCWGMVHRDHHGTGIGRHLAALRIEHALEDPAVQRIRMCTSQHTVGFYERMGFETVEVERDGFAPGFHKHEMVRVVRR